jgi:putative flippase GtrA
MTTSTSTDTPRGRLPHLWEQHRTFVLYTVIGASGVALDLLLFLVLHNAFDVHEIVATAISTTAGITNNFILNAFFNFRRSDGLAGRFVRFYAVGLLGLAMVAALLFVFSTVLGVDPNIVKVLSLPLVLVLQYTLNARWSFGVRP